MKMCKWCEGRRYQINGKAPPEEGITKMLQ